MAKVQQAGTEKDPVPPMTALRDVLKNLDAKDVELAQARSKNLNLAALKMALNACKSDADTPLNPKPPTLDPKR